jgi:hypothetical protein
MNWLTVTHPSTGGTARVSEAALPYHLRAGWTVAPDPEPAAPPAGEPGETAAEPSGDNAAPDPAAGRAPRRRASGEAEENH